MLHCNKYTDYTLNIDQRFDFFRNLYVHQKIKIMKKLAVVLCLIVFFLAASAQKKKELSDTRLAGLDAKFQVLLSDWKAPGFAIAIVEKNKVVYAKGFGYSNYEKKIPVTPNTLFAIGSCSKAFTSSLLGILRNESKLDFNKKPSTYLPDLKFFNNDMDNLITIKDLMCHRTGLPRHDVSWYLFPTDSRDSLMKRIQFQEPSAGIRERYQYNNFMFMLQGMIAEKITGKTWEENVAEKFFKPLGMTSSNFSIQALEKSNDAALGYGLKKDSIIEKLDYYHIKAMSPAGSINSSVNEMAKWVITWIQGGKFEGKEIIPTAYVSEAKSSQMVASSGLPSKENPDIFLNNYGYGWGLSTYRGHYLVNHGGGIDGFSALTSFFPGDSIGIIILSNQGGSAIPSIALKIAADRMLNLQDGDWNAKAKKEREKALKTQKESELKAISNEKKGTSYSHKLIEYAGNYLNPGYGTVKIRAERDSLFAYLPEKTLWLEHVHYDIFQPYDFTKSRKDTTEKSTLRYNFRTGITGDIESFLVNIEPALKPIEFKNQPASIKVEKGALEMYSGEYFIGEMKAKFYTKNADVLYLFVEGQPEYELVATSTHKFSIKSLEGYQVEFIPDENKKITSVLYIQPNGTFKATKKQ